MSPRLADRLSAGRRRRFIGRATELQIFADALAAPELPFSVLFVYGPGGVGKSSLLSQFARMGKEAQIAVYVVDGRNMEATPEAFTAALAHVMDLPSSLSPLEALADQSHRCVILVDTYELLTPLDGWLRDLFLPELPEQILFVTAGRNPPHHAWRADPGWQPLIQTLPLRNLSPDEGRLFLAQRNVPEEEIQRVLDFTHSYPLALSLVADLYDQRPGFHFYPESAPDLVKVLIEQLLQRVPGRVHRSALEASALVRVTTESVLAEMLDLSDISEVFEWLRSLSFMGARPGGIFPHDLAREALIADLRWRNPDWYAELHRRARTYYIQRIEQSTGTEQQLALFDLIFLHRDNPVVRPVFEWQTSGRVLAGRFQEEDLPFLTDMVLRHEGVESAQMARRWLTRLPDEAIVFREADGQPAGFTLFIRMSALADADLKRDPALAAAASLLQRSAPLRTGEQATYFRYWMASTTYQGVSPTQSLIFINMVRHYLATPQLAFTFIPCADPDFWTPVFAYADLARLPEADFVVDGRRYGVFGHDWRQTPPMHWLELLGEREIAMTPQNVKPPVPAERLVVLSEDEFAEAVAAALRELTRNAGLAQNPLLRSRLVVQRSGAGSGQGDRIAALRALLLEAVESLNAVAKDVKLYRAVYHTYVKPAPTQEMAAELLDVPFSSYRRHLKSGVERIVENLWQREVAAQ